MAILFVSPRSMMNALHHGGHGGHGGNWPQSHRGTEVSPDRGRHAAIRKGALRIRRAPRSGATCRETRRTNERESLLFIRAPGFLGTSTGLLRRPARRILL